MKEITTLKTKQELQDYLNNFDFDSMRDTKLSSVYFLVGFDNRVVPIYFSRCDDTWFASPCGLASYPLEDEEIMDVVKEMYNEDSWEDAYRYEQTLHRDGWHYEIHCPQCSPFLPDEIKIVGVLSDSELVDWMLQHRQDKSEGEECE